MEMQYFKDYSPALGRDMECKIYGHAGRPMLYIFSTCKNTLRTLPILQYSARDPEDLDTTEEDHIADALRYFCMMSPLAPEREAKPNYPILDPLAKPKAERISYF